jgi:hypothetical protein
METTNRQFGLLIAYVLPGFIALGGIALLVPAVAQWLQPTGNQSGWDLAPPVYAVLAATAAGVTLSCFRWIIVDHIHHGTGVEEPSWDLAALEKRLDAFNFIVDGCYRYYQAHANMLVAVIWTYSLIRWAGAFALLGPGTDLGVLILCAGLFAGSRDALAKYYWRSNQLIGSVAEKVDAGGFMTNGFHPEGGSKGSGKPKETKSDAKPLTQRIEPAKEGKKSTAKQ